MNPYTIVTVMLGMNRFHQRDDDHPFDMSALDGYNTIWMPQVDRDERAHSTLFYEALKGAEATINYWKSVPNVDITKDNFMFVFGRGTIGRDSENRLFEILQQSMKYYGNNVNHIIIAKSFGVADTLSALHKFGPFHQKPLIQSLILIDGYLPPSKKRKIATKVNGKRVFKIPSFVNTHYNVIQRTKGTKGRRTISKNDNFVVDSRYVEKYETYYSGYKDGYKRKLDVSHFNMEEIVSAVPCIKIAGLGLNLSKRAYKLADAIKEVLSRSICEQEFGVSPVD